MQRRFFPTFAMVLAGSAIVCLGKNTAFPKDCNNKWGTQIDTLAAKVKCGESPFSVFIPRRCRIFRKEDGYPTKTVKITLKEGESGFWQDASCQLTQKGGLKLNKWRRSGLSGCADRWEAGWIDNKDGYGFYCDKGRYPPVIPVSCDFGPGIGVLEAGSRWANKENDGERADCLYDFKDASITPKRSKLTVEPHMPRVTNTKGIFSDTP